MLTAPSGKAIRPSAAAAGERLAKTDGECVVGDVRVLVGGGPAECTRHATLASLRATPGDAVTSHLSLAIAHLIRPRLHDAFHRGMRAGCSVPPPRGQRPRRLKRARRRALLSHTSLAGRETWPHSFSWCIKLTGRMSAMGCLWVSTIDYNSVAGSPVCCPSCYCRFCLCAWSLLLLCPLAPWPSGTPSWTLRAMSRMASA